jgi:hypothetical protein
MLTKIPLQSRQRQEKVDWSKSAIKTLANRPKIPMSGRSLLSIVLDEMAPNHRPSKC